MAHFMIPYKLPWTTKLQGKFISCSGFIFFLHPPGILLSDVVSGSYCISYLLDGKTQVKEKNDHFPFPVLFCPCHVVGIIKRGFWTNNWAVLLSFFWFNSDRNNTFSLQLSSRNPLKRGRTATELEGFPTKITTAD